MYKKGQEIIIRGWNKKAEIIRVFEKAKIVTVRLDNNKVCDFTFNSIKDGKLERKPKEEVEKEKNGGKNEVGKNRKS